MMASKKPENSTTSTKDIDILFSRAGMIGARYREFPRPESSQLEKQELVKPVQASVAAPTAPQPPPARMVVPASASEARMHSTTEQPQPGVSSWTSLERLFADRANGAEAQPPVQAGVKIAMLSLAGGVGKTVLAVSLARILSGQHKQVLLADCGVVPTVPQYFGSRGQRLGPLQFLYSPGSSGLPVGMFRLSSAELHNTDFHDILNQIETSESLLFMDLPTLQVPSATEILANVDHVLVPVTPDVHSIASLATLKQLLAGAGSGLQIHYILNRFDEARPLHHEIKERLRQTLGSSLLPFVIHEYPAIQDALAQGMTIVDYQPDSGAIGELTAVADWLRGLAAANRSASYAGGVA